MQGPFLIFLGDVPDPLDAKTGAGLAQWRREDCVGQWRLPRCCADIGLPDITPAEAARLGARSLVVGVANPGGVISPAWQPALEEALRAGLNLISGMHQRLADLPGLQSLANEFGCTLHDIRQPDRQFSTGSGEPRSGQRLLTVGTDCAVGKKYTALALHKEFVRCGINADFRATGQTGLMIAGEGVVIDAVVADFIAGAAESLSPPAAAKHWDIIEGQGSLFHPAYAGVTTGLIHGSQPDILVLCHQAGRSEIDGMPGFAIPSFTDCMDAYLRVARLTNPQVRFAGLAVNTGGMESALAEQLTNELQQQLDLPCFDPLRSGVASVVEELCRV